MQKLFTSFLIGLLLSFVAFFSITVHADESPGFVAGANCCASIPIAARTGADVAITPWLMLSVADNYPLPAIAKPEPTSLIAVFSVAALKPGIVPNTQGNPPGTSYGTPLHQLLG